MQTVIIIMFGNSWILNGNIINRCSLLRKGLDIKMHNIRNYDHSLVLCTFQLLE